MTENKPIKTVSDGITFLSTGRYHDGINQWVAHKLKDGDHDAIDYAARQIAKLLPQNAVLVPIPGHHGKAEQTMQLARAISSYTYLPIVDALRGIERESQYDAKKRGQTLSAEDMGFSRQKKLALESYTLSHRQCSRYRQHRKGCYQSTWLWNCCFICNE